MTEVYNEFGERINTEARCEVCQEREANGIKLNEVPNRYVLWKTHKLCNKCLDDAKNDPI